MDDSEVKETLSPEGSAQESFGGIFSDFKLYVLVYTGILIKKSQEGPPTMTSVISQ